MTVLVTGAAGHLGEALMRTLRAEGRPARGLDRLPSPFVDVAGSITNRETVRAAMDGVSAVIHAATLHKPHVATHPKQGFVDVNVTGTLTLLEAAAEAGARAFVFTSTTSAFGRALSPGPGAPAAWIDETVTPVPKNVYGVTKTAAEDLCALVSHERGLPCVILRTSRFFPEEDDEPEQAATWDGENLKVVELLHRRLDVADAVSAHLLAVARAPALGFAMLIASATTPFRREDAAALREDAAAVIEARIPGAAAAFAARGWRLPRTLDRVYDNARARAALGWRPAWDFAAAVARLKAGAPVRSALAEAVGSKGYHREG